MRRVKKACVSLSAIPSWWSTQPSKVTLVLKISSPMRQAYNLPIQQPRTPSSFPVAPGPANSYVCRPDPITPWSPQWISPRCQRRDPHPFRKLCMSLVILDPISLSTPDGRPLFDGLTLALGRERTGLVGRNGCGKSTLLRLIAGEIEPAGGAVRRERG